MKAVTFPRGFRASGIACGLKESGKTDLALIVSDVPASVAGMFTQNRVVAAPVTLSRQVVTAGSARATVVNSGNANACTGAQGESDAREMAALTAEQVGCDARRGAGRVHRHHRAAARHGAPADGHPARSCGALR